MGFAARFSAARVIQRGDSPGCREHRMAFIHVSAPHGRRVGGLLSADNPPALPDRFAVMDIIRRAAPLIGLKAPVVATLDTLLSCLPPKRNHHIVFASNQTLAFRRDGVSDRTLRRHFALLEEAGLLARHDSPNGKRFSKHDPETAMALRFGLDLAPLFARLPDLTAAAEAARRAEEHLRYLRLKLRAAVAGLPMAEDTLRLLRRKLTASEMQALLDALPKTAQPVENPVGNTPPMSGTDGQIVRHHHKSEKEPDDKPTDESKINVPILLAACPQAAEFAMNEVRSIPDVIRHASTLAPMMGIDTPSYRAAETRQGALPAALAVWLILSLGNRVQKIGAYFRSLTTGRHAEDFDPWRVILRRAGLSADNTHSFHSGMTAARNVN